jgi:hypothetical protein
MLFQVGVELFVFDRASPPLFRPTYAGANVGHLAGFSVEGGALASPLCCFLALEYIFDFFLEKHLWRIGHGFSRAVKSAQTTASTASRDWLAAEGMFLSTHKRI